MFMKKIYRISIYVVAMMLTLASLLSCRYDPLDSYSRVPPDRTGESGEDKGGLGGAFASGFGTPESPYIIATAQHLANMPQGLSPEEMVYFRLSADIDMKDIPWVPLNNRIHTAFLSILTVTDMSSRISTAKDKAIRAFSGYSAVSVAMSGLLMPPFPAPMPPESLRDISASVPRRAATT